VLQAVCLLVAGIGVTLTLLIAAREHSAETALMRAVGASRRQIFRVFLGKGLGLGLGGAALGMAGGVLLAMILIHSINFRYFGWTIRTDWRALWMVSEYSSLLAVVVLASLWPALKASRTPAAELSRDEV
jgi:putative ABC transport system permease protein